MNKKRLKNLLQNALIWINEECSDFFVCEVDDEYEWFGETIGITEKELTELDITLRKGETEL